MIITCGGCGKRYKADPAKFKKDSFTVKCSDCNHQIKIEKPTEKSHLLETGIAEPIPRPIPKPELKKKRKPSLRPLLLLLLIIIIGGAGYYYWEYMMPGPVYSVK